MKRVTWPPTSSLDFYSFFWRNNSLWKITFFMTLHSSAAILLHVTWLFVLPTVVGTWSTCREVLILRCSFQQRIRRLTVCPYQQRGEKAFVVSSRTETLGWLFLILDCKEGIKFHSSRSCCRVSDGYRKTELRKQTLFSTTWLGRHLLVCWQTV